MVASGTRKQPSLGELGGARAREGGSHGPGFSSRLRAVPSAQPESDQTLWFAPTRLPHRPSAPHTQLLHLGSSRLAQGAADSPAGPALDLGRGHEGRGLGDRGSGSGPEVSQGSLGPLTSPRHSTIFVPQFPRFVSEKGGHSQTGKPDTNELSTRVQKESLRMQGLALCFILFCFFSFPVSLLVCWDCALCAEGDREGDSEAKNTGW